MPHTIIKKILQARVYDVAVETPASRANQLSKRLGNEIILKREDLQPVFSFKIRGAYNKICQLSQEELDRGVIAASAGNHAQGLALAAKKLGVKATIVMPATTPDVKVSAVRNHGAEVVLFGDAFDEASVKSKEIMAQTGQTYVHPFDDLDTIAGQGTIGMEILHQIEGDIDAIFVPVGGGGLIAGVAAYIKYLRPEIKVIGVEPEDAACLKAAMKAGKPTRLDQVGIFAEGVAVAEIGEHTFKIAKDNVDDVITVTTDEMCAAIKDIYDDTRSITEPAGACALAGLKKYVESTGAKDKKLIAINSGANVNFDRLRHVSERAELGEKREAIIAVKIPEEPGAFKGFCQALVGRNITEFNYRYGDAEQAVIFVGVAIGNSPDSRQELLNDLKDYEIVDLTDDETTKVHVRHMIGGHLRSEKGELLYSFEFPERPGALLKFLNTLGGQWNISMFHYRNHGDAYGRVLVGLQAVGEETDVTRYLDELGYPYQDENDNAACELFFK
ncbi:threonine ammonia-lyase, biosynthetic [Marinomonas mediterranea]|jgi:L-threonine ammonia-lyase (EC 4.3.1.19)|uniref:L-threonine dehydratase n=1 Tax=Marinomonas mediterranea (strain ATCC 700492 / JCM 21426 / NBRC 103028 / MMB-1) TaxID=717774 RepID=F2JWU4_MARM1|nr:threonine ammonia-lyase, biosynthetic [Marinomonas mediterranea]ADZ92961.1 threonine dehydratase, biosynthetic [Marinomonas mediterranea MMB-1]WCN14936.1 threonine ammonia-lyase, biosynthetic [Marinomonas mediterranea]WCN18980.1 threonine ammonia-lyase, biosynthetic [Marinomonas mediterranea MMB-1]